MSETVKHQFSPYLHHLDNGSPEEVDSLWLQFCQPTPFKPPPGGTKIGCGAQLCAML